MTVRDVIQSAACSTAGFAPLSRQVIREMLALEPGSILPLVSPKIHADPHVHLYTQAQPRASLAKVLAGTERTLIVNSCFRVLPEQVALYTFYQEGRCNVTLAAPPGESPHEDGLALDVAAALTWREDFEAHGWQYLGPGDRMHYQYLQPGVRRDLGALGVRAFQTLAARHGIGVKVDGRFGPATRAAVLASPAAGWPE